MSGLRCTHRNRSSRRDLLDDVVAADESRARLFGFLDLVAGSDDANFFDLPKP
jgi:hypothetical protein